MEEAIDLVLAYGAPAGPLSAVSQSMRYSVLENDRQILKGMLRRYNTDSIYVVARDATQRNDHDTMEKLALQYSSWLPIPWDYLARFISDRRMFDIFLPKLQNGDIKKKLIFKFGTDYEKSLLDNQDRYGLTCDNIPQGGKNLRTRFRLWIKNENVDCIDNDLFEKIQRSYAELGPLANNPLNSIIYLILDNKVGVDILYRLQLRANDVAPLIEDKLVPRDMLIWYKSIGGQLSDLQQRIIDDSLTEEDLQDAILREYVVENDLIRSYDRMNNKQMRGVIINEQNTETMLKYISETHAVFLKTPEQVAASLTRRQLRPNEYNYILMPALDMLLNKDTAIDTIAKVVNWGIDMDKVYKILDLKNLHPSWFEYYIRQNTIPRPEDLSEKFWKQLLTAAIKYDNNLLAEYILQKEKPYMDFQTKEKLRNYIKNSTTIQTNTQNKLLKIL